MVFNNFSKYHSKDNFLLTYNSALQQRELIIIGVSDDFVPVILNNHSLPCRKMSKRKFHQALLIKSKVS